MLYIILAKTGVSEHTAFITVTFVHVPVKTTVYVKKDLLTHNAPRRREDSRWLQGKIVCDLLIFKVLTFVFLYPSYHSIGIHYRNNELFHIFETNIDLKHYNIKGMSRHIVMVHLFFQGHHGFCHFMLAKLKSIHYRNTHLSLPRHIVACYGNEL